MYVPFQDAIHVPIEIEAISDYRLGDFMVPKISATAALDGNGHLVIGLVNLHAQEGTNVQMAIEGFEPVSASGRVLTGQAIDAHNDFDEPNRLAPSSIEVEISGADTVVSLPARSVTVLIIEGKSP